MSKVCRVVVAVSLLALAVSRAPAQGNDPATDAEVRRVQARTDAALSRYRTVKRTQESESAVTLYVGYYRGNELRKITVDDVANVSHLPKHRFYLRNGRLVFARLVNLQAVSGTQNDWETYEDRLFFAGGKLLALQDGAGVTRATDTPKARRLAEEQRAFFRHASALLNAPQEKHRDPF